MTNDLLRAHVTRVGFNLTLSKAQIAALIHLDVELSDPRPFGEVIKDQEAPGRLRGGHGRHLLSSSIVSQHALMTRGLVTHRLDPRPAGEFESRCMRDSWAITPAGRAVIDLLKESGLYEEIAAEIPWAKPPTPEQTGMDPQQEIERLRARAEAAERRVAALKAEVEKEQRRAIEAGRKAIQAEHELGRLKERIRDAFQDSALAEAVSA